MKKSFLGIVLAVASLGVLPFASSCNKDKGKFNQSESVQELNADLNFTIPLIAAAGEYDSLQSFNFIINMDSFVKSFDQKYTLQSIQAVRLKSCVITANTMDPNSNFRNLHMANLSIASASNANQLRIAVANDIVDTAAYYLSMPTWYNPNLASYFKCDSICYRFYGNARRGTSLPLDCRATLKYEMVLAN